MHVLISDSQSFETQKRDSGAKRDFHWTGEGEILTFTVGGPCCSAASCGCGRSFSGLTSAKGTTIGFVAEIEESELRKQLAEGKLISGWLALDTEIDEMILGELQQISSTLERYPAGHPVRVKNTKRFSQLQPAPLPVAV